MRHRIFTGPEHGRPHPHLIGVRMISGQVHAGVKPFPSSAGNAAVDHVLT
jgi:hypothetical protein